jgi:class 3 adenylate cyclase/tetratricopeptide (TPR) repeat protein
MIRLRHDLKDGTTVPDQNYRNHSGGNMRCSKCGSDNREGRKFCTSCGTPLAAACPKCDAPIQPDESFCGECGTALGNAAPATDADTTPITASAGGERRHLTVLFCDLVGSTEIAARLDPEEWRETVAAYHRAAAEVITRYGGHVAKYLGDGVMAFFGYPEAHDNDAERAARAGLAMLDAISKLGDQAGCPKLTARVGIDSGAVVVVGAGAGKEADVFGEAPNIAARVQAAAEPSTALITDAVHRLVSGLFVVENHGAPALKGIERPVELYRVVQPSGVRGRLGALAATRALTPFVGRESELRLLGERWELACEGEGQVALIVGEAGIGKSRLIQRFHEQLTGQPKWLEAGAAPFFQNTPFHAIAELLRQLVGRASLPATDAQAPRAIAGDGEAQLETNERLAQLESAVIHAGLKVNEAIPLIAPLLNLPASGKYPVSRIPPEQQRRRLLAVLVEWVLGAARALPLVIVIEDLHWADASTLEVVQLLAEQGPTAHLLLLCTARPEVHPPWPLRAHHVQLTLNRLGARNVREMIAQVAARNALAGDTVDAVIERTGGVPLFVEELTRAVLESGGARPGREIPVTLHDSLMARLDRLGPAKEVIQIGAVIGSEFSYELLQAVHPVCAEELQSALRSATDAELVYVRGIAPEATYQFKHALIRDAAYEALLKSRRRELHRRVALAIDEKFPALREAHSEVLARHWTEAGETERATAEWQRAGKAAEARNAFREALESYRQATALVKHLPESPERELHELELAGSIVRPLIIIAGYSAPETIEAIEHATVLVEKSGSLKQLVELLVTQAAAYFAIGNLRAGIALADRALELAVRDGRPVSFLYAHTWQMLGRRWVGDLAGVEEHFKAGLKSIEDPDLMRVPDNSVSENLVVAFAAASLNAWTMGRADVARERGARMMTIKHTNPYAAVLSTFFAAKLHAFLREDEQAEAFAERALELSERHQFTQPAALARALLGDARARLGRVAEGIALIRHGIADLLEIGTRLEVSSYTAHLAAALERTGAIAEALETVEQALGVNPEEMYYRAEIFRIRGELRLKQGQTGSAEADFRESIALAQRMGAKAYELRTTMSFARLLDQQGRRDEARTMLAEIYNWFTEGFDTADLKDAKALLEELAT